MGLGEKQPQQRAAPSSDGLQDDADRGTAALPGPVLHATDPGLGPRPAPYSEAAIWEPLADLYGLERPKAQVARFVAFARVQRLRRSRGLVCPRPLLHMVLSGEPGTGKTEFARRLAVVLYRAGLTADPGLVEVSRKDLVDRYIGHTAQRTQQVLTEARGRVLLIDEAYALVRDRLDRRDFGHEALATLIKALEDDRGEFCCILTGYDREMAEFLDVNTGLRSRIGFFLRFSAYTAPELQAIAALMAGRWGVELDGAARQALGRALKDVAGAGLLAHYGNARMVRHLVEKCVMEQAYRLVQQGLAGAAADDLVRVTEIGRAHV